jgi:ureidoglycolate lyase/seryl-tRNA synthetase
MMQQVCNRLLQQSTRGRFLSTKGDFVFCPDNFKNPQLPDNLKVLEVPLTLATEESLQGYGKIIDHKNQISVSNKNFEISKFPVSGWRQLDPGTGDEAGTTEGDFEVEWKGDFFYGHNLAVATDNNYYLDGMGNLPEDCTHEGSGTSDGKNIYLWMADYHPCGGQLFFPQVPVPFVVNLGKSTTGDDVKPEDMRAFYVPEGKGVYFHPSTWHNGVYTHKTHGKVRFLTRQSKVHARVSVSWAAEFSTLLKVSLQL